MKHTAGSVCFALFAVAAFVLPATVVAQDTGVVAHDAWVRMPAPSKMDAALYLVLENHTSTPKAVVSASSDAAAKLELHEMKMVKKDDSMDKSSDSMGKSDSMNNSAAMSMDKSSSQPMMTMMPVSKVVVPANGKVTLAPNGLHIMMFGLKSRPSMGDKINITLKLDDGGTVPVTAIVK